MATQYRRHRRRHAKLVATKLGRHRYLARRWRNVAILDRPHLSRGSKLSKDNAESKSLIPQHEDCIAESTPAYQHEDDAESLPPPRFLANIGDEDPERYGTGGFHPVQLGDTYDDGRYRVVQKLGAGGFSTVWLAQDATEHQWVALKVVIANHSASVEAKSWLSRDAASQATSGAACVVEHRHFIIDGPNGRHLCLVLPVMGPSASRLSDGFTTRIDPQLSRRASYRATRALTGLHAQGLCHGDVTTANILFGLSSIDRYTEDKISRLFSVPETAPLETECREAPGPEAPKYIVKSLDFLSSKTNFLCRDVALTDFDQSFLVSSPPETMLGTPPEFLAPEVAVGLKPGFGSDVWALGCCIFRLRAGVSPFSGYEVTSPADLVRVVMQSLGDLPSAWGVTLFDDDGQPTKDPTNGKPPEKWVDERPIKDLVYKIWDRPENDIVRTGTLQSEHKTWGKDENKPYPSCFSGMVWKPTAVKIDNTYLRGFDEDTGVLIKVMPKISDGEAALLYDLLSKVFVYNPHKRISARDMLNHTWFHMDDTGLDD